MLKSDLILEYHDQKMRTDDVELSNDLAYCMKENAANVVQEDFSQPSLVNAQENVVIVRGVFGSLFSYGFPISHRELIDKFVYRHIEVMGRLSRKDAPVDTIKSEEFQRYFYFRSEVLDFVQKMNKSSRTRVIFERATRKLVDDIKPPKKQTMG